MVGFFTIVLGVICILSLICYIIQGISLYNLGKNRGIKTAWMGWIPLLNLSLIGELIDDTVSIGKIKLKHAKLMLPILSVLGLVIYNIPFIGIFLALAVYVIICFAYYELFKQYNEESAAVFTVIGGIFPFILPFFLLSIKDLTVFGDDFDEITFDDEEIGIEDNHIFDEEESKSDEFSTNEVSKKSKKHRREELSDDPEINDELRILDEELLKIEKDKLPKKKKVHRNIFSFKSISREINGYGYSYSMADYFKSMLLAFAVMIGAGILLRLDATHIFILCIACIILVPNLVITQFKYVYEQKRFSDAISYMETMIFEFKKRPKILNALIAVEDTADDDLRKRLQKSIDFIHDGRYEKNLYAEAFKFIEDRYFCERMHSLHKFLIKVEETGGEYQSSINILLDDIKLWTQRVYETQTERKGIKGKMTLVIVLALIIFMSLTFMVPSDFSIIGTPAYQIVTTVSIIALMIIYTGTQMFLTGDWLATDSPSKEQTLKDYKFALVGSVKKMRKKILPVVILMIGVMIYGFTQANTVLIVAGLAGAVVLWLQPKQKMKAIKKRSMREINKSFPSWLRDQALTLQKENVQVAITNSLPEAPIALIVPLRKLVKDLEEDPTTIRPYNNFLKSFDLPDISSAMKMLYAMNEAGREEAVAQINTLVERNNQLLEKAERLRNEDVNALSGFVVALPMVVTLVKTATDMGLILMNFMSMMA